MISRIDAEKMHDPLNSHEGRKHSLWSRLSGFLVGTRKRFYISIAYISALMLMLTAALLYAVFNIISIQELRNNYLKIEVSKLDKQIEEVKKLGDQTNALLARRDMVGVISNNDQLETSVLDQLACRIVPRGIYLTGIDKENGKYTLHGVADTVARVTSLMNAVENSPWLHSGKILRINEAVQSGGRDSSNSVNFDIEAALALPQKTKPRASGESSPPPSGTGADTGVTELSGNDAPAVSNLVWLTVALIVSAALLRGLWRVWRLIKDRSKDATLVGGDGIPGMLQRMGVQIRSFQPRDVETWPPVVRLIVLCEIFLILVVACWLFASSEYETYTESVEIEIRLKDAYLKKKRWAINLDLIRKQLLEIQMNLRGILKGLPGNKNTMNDQLDEAIRLTRLNGLHLIENYPEGSEVVKGQYIAQMTWVLKVRGSFERIGHFISDLSRSGISLSFQNYKLAPASSDSKNGGDMILDSTVKVYRLLDEDEVAAQRKSMTNSGVKK